MRKLGLRELSDLVDERREAIAAFLPSWWTEVERKADCRKRDRACPNRGHLGRIAKPHGGNCAYIRKNNETK